LDLALFILSKQDKTTIWKKGSFITRCYLILVVPTTTTTTTTPSSTTTTSPTTTTSVSSTTPYYPCDESNSFDGMSDKYIIPSENIRINEESVTEETSDLLR
jgi:hypothetical protein